MQRKVSGNHGKNQLGQEPGNHMCNQGQVCARAVEKQWSLGTWAERFQGDTPLADPGLETHLQQKRGWRGTKKRSPDPLLNYPPPPQAHIQTTFGLP